MTREQVIKWWKEIEAFKNGKEIQYRNKQNDKWNDAETPTFSFNTEYRIKPEPILIPFDYSDAKFLIGKAIKHKILNYVELIKFISDKFVGDISFNDLLKDYTFLDGAACGKIKQ